MMGTPPTVNELDEYDQMLKDFSERMSLYGFVEIRCVSVNRKSEKGEDSWTGMAFKVIPHRKDEERGEERNYNYRDVIFRRIYVSADDFLEILKNSRENKILRIPGDPELEYNVIGLKRRHPGLIYAQRAKEFGIEVEWPCIIYHTEGNRTREMIHDDRPLVRLDLPFYPYFSIAFESEIGIPWNSNITAEIIIPDYRARIRKLKLLSERKLYVEVDLFGISPDEMVGKYYYSGRTIRTGNFDIKSGIIELDSEIKYMQVALISKEEEVLDSRWFSTIYGSQVEFEPTEENLENIIYRGENERVEFKLKIENIDDLLETIVAFANKSGGIIIVGVNDNGEVVGFDWKNEKKGESLEDWLSKIIREKCDPPSIDFNVKEDLRLQEKPLALIEVKEGKNKPYLLKNKCPYIRVGSTDRCMTRWELDDLYSQKIKERWIETR
ncbi:ATP-binding protein [Candidatus Korarchaeum cryptofilum]|uniref:ATP-binding protein n=2 Tax=Candidatus Korarchaeum cryptofilum TaxID=498846 RepID=A0A3R9QT74_9CREN|nr:ATP-binding protein [Candidatus Korarchaeum cryptofilum]